MKLTINLSADDHEQLCEAAHLLNRSPVEHAEKVLSASIRRNRPRNQSAKFPRGSEREYLTSTRVENSKQPSPIIASLKKAAAQNK